VADFVYPPVIAAVLGMFRALNLKITVEGSEHVPTSGGAVIASNHVSYLDFIFAGLAARPSRRLVRFMAKKAVFDNRVAGPLMRGMHHIAVDRSAGAGSYADAVRALTRGEVVGIFPEATISRSFTLKETKSGSARMAFEAKVPVVPVGLWGTQRLWTKGLPKNFRQRGIAITILVGEPLHPADFDGPDALARELRTRLAALVERAQREYPQQPAGESDRWWLPAHLGGTAPTPEEALELDRRRPE
jgi:1-acyl-sn-glycerol-3-phosphate acyltransferase